MAKTAHIAVVSVPMFSHQQAIFEFCKRLVHLYPDIHVTCIIPTLGSHSNASKAIIESLNSFNIDSIVLPPANLDNLAQRITIETQVPLAMSSSMPSIHSVLKSLRSTTKLVALVADYFAYEALEFAKKLNILSYIYFPTAAMVLSLCLYSSKLDEAVSCEYKDLPESIKIPGCIPVHGRDLPNSLRDRSSIVYKQFLQRCKELRIADGILVNSFLGIEAGAIRAMQEEGRGNPPVYSVGPIIQDRSVSLANGSECLRWLDKQPPISVLYVSFGSGGTVPQEQLNELALGLELSGQKFLCVVKEPKESPSAIYFSGSKEDPLQFLPSGFLERTKGQGLVIPSWAPQVEILSHNATGAFLAQCGWNSTLESVVNGIPIIAWPLFAEQRMIAAMLTDDLKVALRPKVTNKGIVDKEEIGRVIKSLMEGDEGKGIRERMKKLKEAAADELTKDGFSTKNLSQLAIKWKKFGRL